MWGETPKLQALQGLTNRGQQADLSRIYVSVEEQVGNAEAQRSELN